MKRILTGATMAALLASTAAIADPGGKHGNRGNHGNSPKAQGRHDNGRHNGWGNDRGQSHNWSRGERMGYNDWQTAQQVDYRTYRLRQPPRGYEWRRNNDRFLLVAVATGLIASVIFSSGR